MSLQIRIRYQNYDGARGKVHGIHERLGPDPKGLQIFPKLLMIFAGDLFTNCHEFGKLACLPYAEVKQGGEVRV